MSTYTFANGIGLPDGIDVHTSRTEAERPPGAHVVRDPGDASPLGALVEGRELFKAKQADIFVPTLVP